MLKGSTLREHRTQKTIRKAQPFVKYHAHGAGAKETVSRILTAAPASLSVDRIRPGLGRGKSRGAVGAWRSALADVRSRIATRGQKQLRSQMRANLRLCTRRSPAPSKSPDGENVCLWWIANSKINWVRSSGELGGARHYRFTVPGIGRNCRRYFRFAVPDTAL